MDRAEAGTDAQEGILAVSSHEDKGERVGSVLHPMFRLTLASDEIAFMRPDMTKEEQKKLGNNGVSFDYVKGHTVIGVSTKVLAKHKLKLVFDELDESYEDKSYEKKGDRGAYIVDSQRAWVRVKATIYDAYTGSEVVSVVCSSDGKNTTGRAKLTALTIAKKAAVCNLLGIGLGIDQEEEAPRAAQPKTEPKAGGFNRKPNGNGAPVAPSSGNGTPVPRLMSVQSQDELKEWLKAHYAKMSKDPRFAAALDKRAIELGVPEGMVSAFVDFALGVEEVF